MDYEILKIFIIPSLFPYLRGHLWNNFTNLREFRKPRILRATWQQSKLRILRVSVVRKILITRLRQFENNFSWFYDFRDILELIAD